MRKNNEQSLKEVLLELLQQYRLKQGVTEWRIREVWERTMGPVINRHTKEIRLSRRRLYVRVDSSPLRSELSYGREKIRKLLNEDLGESYLEEVIIR